MCISLCSDNVNVGSSIDLPPMYDLFLPNAEPCSEHQLLDKDSGLHLLFDDSCKARGQGLLLRDPQTGSTAKGIGEVEQVLQRDMSVVSQLLKAACRKKTTLNAARQTKSQS